MGLLNLVLWGAGVALIVIGYTRARGPLARYNALKEQDANVARYEAWRGGTRGGADRRVGRDADPAPPGPDRDRGGRRRVRADLRWASSSAEPSAAGYPSIGPPTELDRRAAIHHDARARPSAAIGAASQLTMPSCSQKQRAPTATASCACGHDLLGAAEDVDEVERPAWRPRPPRASGTPGSRWTDVSFGFTGTQS